MSDTASTGTPVLTLGFTREELEAMEERAFPDNIHAWIHGVIAAALDGTIDYKHQWPLEPDGDASSAVVVVPLDFCEDGSRPDQCDASSTGGRCDVCGVEQGQDSDEPERRGTGA